MSSVILPHLRSSNLPLRLPNDQRHGSTRADRKVKRHLLFRELASSVQLATRGSTEKSVAEQSAFP